MKRAIRILLLLLVTAVFARAEVLKVVVHDTIHPITEEYIARALDEAKKSKADAVLIELRTPGGLADTTRTIVEKILASEVPVIVYVAPSGGYAASAGFFILQAADIAAMAPATNTGAAHPVRGDGQAMDEVMKSKAQNDSAAFMRAFVSKRGRNVEVAESAVRESKSFTEQEALDKKVIDIVAKDEADLLKQVDGRTITRFDGRKVTLKLANKNVRMFEMTVKQKVLAFLMNPNIAFLLFSIGMLAIYAEFNNPGAILPGVVGLVCVLLAVFALNILPVRYAAVAMILGAFVLFGLEVKFQSYGLLGIGGTLLLILGGLMLVDGPIPEMRVGLWTSLAVSVPIAIITIFLMSIAYRAHQNKITTGQEGMIGQVGYAQTPLAPAGKVFVMGEIWNAVCPGHAATGEAVKVRRVEGLELEVEKVNRAEAKTG